MAESYHTEPPSEPQSWSINPWTVAAEQQPCGVQVVEGVGLVSANELVEKLKTLIYKTLPLFS